MGYFYSLDTFKSNISLKLGIHVADEILLVGPPFVLLESEQVRMTLSIENFNIMCVSLVRSSSYRYK